MSCADRRTGRRADRRLRAIERRYARRFHARSGEWHYISRRLLRATQDSLRRDASALPRFLLGTSPPISTPSASRAQITRAAPRDVRGHRIRSRRPISRQGLVPDRDDAQPASCADLLRHIGSSSCYITSPAKVVLPTLEGRTRRSPLLAKARRDPDQADRIESSRTSRRQIHRQPALRAGWREAMGGAGTDHQARCQLGVKEIVIGWRSRAPHVSPSS